MKNANKQTLTFDTNNIYINRKSYKPKSFRIGSNIFYTIAIIAFIMGIPTFMIGGFIFVIIGLFSIWSGHQCRSLYQDFLSHRDQDSRCFGQKITHENRGEHIPSTEYNDTVRAISQKYYTGVEDIEAMWSVMHNLKITTGEKADLFEKACYENIDDLKALIDAEESINYPNDIPPHVPAFVRLTMLYEKQGRYEEAINICVTAIKCGAVNDGSNGKMYGRLARLIKKSGISPSPEITSLLIGKK